MVLNITDSARNQIFEMLKEEDADSVRLRFGVKGGGCSGLSYSLGFDYDVNEELDHMEEANGIPVTIKKFDINVIEGTTIDFKQNMMGGGFTIDNPNAIISCGCGSSFKAKEREGAPESC
ncbi:iron-sulfur cluster assembly accessory protein [Gracilibacillus sp. S3-1-1]|uniref:Iron-sulfur cluster assembly accessory protein n=1 Tax=Gracilibacillus pellucidus TaxID=3095368 RepID=A0ACC6M1D3_9BACI|nr:iron-sulfur cluster assembly accessory protein [Gracilibacillus sp. S3-1-1]MDX8044758.1 iron-sulfur cluster assembly accessory protein [Gracilibacillus sp. S3-1-1]